MSQTGSTQLAKGDIIIAGNGQRWQVNAIESYSWAGKRQKAYTLIGLTEDLPQMYLTRNELTEWFGGR